MKDEVKAAAAAFQFLSRFPVKMNLDFTPELMQRSTVYYPLVGICIGLILWVAGIVSGLVLPSLPASIVTLVVWVWLTGGLHLDGWMDSADALLSYRSRERMLEIMKDSRVGAMGVIACVLLLMLKASLLVSFIHQPIMMGMAILPLIWSRFFMVYAIFRYPSARAGEGLAAMFGTIPTRFFNQSLGWAIGMSMVLLSMISIINHSPSAVAQVPVLIAFIIVPIVMWAIGRLAADRMSTRLGGLSGDTYGALNEGLETLGLLMLTMVLHIAA
ncbi:adenosylcobinamide-GDP ribazoletransferase [Paenibacillus provencensis]|uniref:Adenosylcobinamide-GDP ribazoletransferase n=1 Tax=Paenibacillus provencensis TaxID=441151 RepID=A0ABW3PTZ4_9BACL|nr:adenosylcobinamide-GDP ribazoletransferase [Paenibacillus sp. MER 78]MCM3127594.1 adenosylcobinamide-GDP ribazoletransferase [Paenibacillus sp. MER 78]